MNMAFVTGIKFVEWANQPYATTFSYDIIRTRYLAAFDNLTVFASAFPGNEQTPRDMELASGPGVDFVFQQSARRPADFMLRQPALRRELEQCLADCAGAIIRLPSTVGILAAQICRQRGWPYLIETVGCPWDSLWNHSGLGKLLAPRAFWQQRHAVRHAPFVIYTSREFLQRRYPTRGQATHCSNVALPPVDETCLARRRERQTRTPAEIRLGSCSQIDLPFKGHRLVLQAMARLNQLGGNYQYEVVGAGDPRYLTKWARKYGVADQVHLLGKKKQADVLKWMETVDIYIQPSLTEGLPRALVEAMSRGVPCLGSDVGGIPELLPAACRFAPGQVSSLMTAIRNIRARLPAAAAENCQRAREYTEVVINARRQSILAAFQATILPQTTAARLQATS